MKKQIFAAAMLAPLAGCATGSFAPPPVNPQAKAYVSGPAGCTASATPSADGSITHDVEGALALTDNFVLAYRCAERELANGRQYFQLPSFAAAVVGLVGPTLGLGPERTLIAGTTASVFNMGNSYYAPRAKAGIVSAAARAVLCIKTEAVGITYFDLVTKDEESGGTVQSISETSSAAYDFLNRLEARERQLEARLTTDPAAEQQLRSNREQQEAIIAAMSRGYVTAMATASDDTIYLPAERQYYEMVSGALFSVETIVAERLGDTGSADTKGLFDQLTKLAEEHAAAKKKLEEEKKKKTTPEPGGAGTMSVEAIEQQANLIELENEVLRPRLQICVLQARA